MGVLVGGIRELRDRLPGMMTLISLAISVAFAVSQSRSGGAATALLTAEVAIAIGAGTDVAVEAADVVVRE
jgi:Cu2+-exporting ATPase